MPKYVVEIAEIYTKHIIIDAENSDAAQEEAEELYEADAEDIMRKRVGCDTNIEVLHEALPDDLENFEEY